MMFKEGLVAVIVANGKIVREMNSGGTSTVYLPFGSEYSIRFKNNDSRRAAVNVTIDDRDVLGGRRLVVDPNSESEIEGFLEASGNIAKNAFRFIEKTDKIRDHRGDKINDGIVRIEFQYENPPYRSPQLDRYDDYLGRYPKPRPMWQNSNSNVLRKSRGIETPTTGGFVGPAGFAAPSAGFQCNVRNDSESLDFNDAGITVAGSHVNQHFGTTTLGSLDSTKHVIVFELRGAKTNGQPIVQPVLSRQKVQCPTCGKHCKSSAKFCAECSTCLV